MRRLGLLLPLVLAATGAGCGEPAGDAPMPKAPPHASAPAPASEGDSAFRLAAAPGEVPHTLDLDLFRKGVRREDPRDAIPAILEPRFVRADAVDFMRPERRVIEVRVGEDVRGYPLHLLDRHELVNDVVGGTPVLVSWCPLCGSAVVYDRRVGERTLTFGVSGYLYKSDVLMYDHQTETFWSQLALRAVAGPLTGTELRVLPSSVAAFGAFQTAHPEAPVLDDEQGIVPPEVYLQAPYRGYDRMPNVWFPVGTQSGALHPKADVVGIEAGGAARAYTVAGLRQAGGTLEDTLGATKLTLQYDAVADRVLVRDAGGAPVAHVRLFWFAWFAFHADTDLWRGGDQPLLEAPGRIPAAEGQAPPR